MKTTYVLIRLTSTGFAEHPAQSPLRYKAGKIYTFADGELYAFISPGGDVAKVKAIMINRAIGDAVLQIKSAEERIEKLRGMRP